MGRQNQFETVPGFSPEAPSGPGGRTGAGGMAPSPAAILATQLRGRPVRSARAGEALGHVSQVLLDLSRRAIAGFRLRHGGLLDRRWRLAAFDDVVAVTPTAVLLPDRLALREDVWAAEVVVAHRWTPVVRAADGHPLGRVCDARCDPRTGQIVALGLRPLSGKPALPPAWLPAGLVARWGADVLLLSVDGSAAARLATTCLEYEA